MTISDHLTSSRTGSRYSKSQAGNCHFMHSFGNCRTNRPLKFYVVDRVLNCRSITVIYGKAEVEIRERPCPKSLYLMCVNTHPANGARILPPDILSSIAARSKILGFIQILSRSSCSTVLPLLTPDIPVPEAEIWSPLRLK